MSAPHPGDLLEWNGTLGRAIRSGSWTEQSVATSRLMAEAISAGDDVSLATLARYFLVEAEVCFGIYRQWTADLRDLLLDWGAEPDRQHDREQQIVALLAHPDGRPWDAQSQWRRVQQCVETVCATPAADQVAALRAVDELVEQWRQCHDRDVDHIGGLMNEVVRQHGESAIGPMYDAVLRPWFDARYSVFDVDKHPWQDAMRLNLLVAYEAMRGHLCGPGRRGDIETIETEDRVVLSFDPCGSGGRQVRGDDIERTPPRDQAPYGWPLTREPAPWNHYEPGVCTYCAHCIVLTEIMPMRAFGYPVRAVDPPRPVADGEAPQKCSWTVFKDPKQIPAHYYERVGLRPPSVIGSAACGGDPTATPPGPPPAHRSASEPRSS